MSKYSKASVGLGVYKIHEDVQLPQQMTKGSACFDLAAFFHEDTVTAHNSYNRKEKVRVHDIGDGKRSVVLHSDQRMLIPTGIIFDIPAGYSLRLHPRSSLAWKQGLTLANCEGVVDEDYVNETFLMILNTSETSVTIEQGERLAQAELVPTLPIISYAINEAPGQKTERDGGFGSTGKR